jgi:hypothetical protein
MKRSSLITQAGLFILTFLTISCSTTSTPTASKASQPSEVVPYVSDSNLAPAEATKANSQTETPKVYELGNEIAIVTANFANVREDSSLTSSVVSQAERNDLLLLDGDDQAGPWYRVIHARTGQKGWIHSDVIRLFRDQSLIAEDTGSKRAESDEVETEVSQSSESRSSYSTSPLPTPTVSQSSRARRYEAPEDSFPVITPSPQNSPDTQRTYSPPSYTPSYTPSRSTPPASDYSPGTVSVRGYTRKDGTYVAPHVRTAPNKSKLDNWSTKGNVNPITGKRGTKSPF